MSVRSGARRVDITPLDPLPLAGFSSRQQPSKGVAEPLEANILSLAHEGRRLHLVSLDLLYGGPVASRVRATVGTADHDEVFALGSHTHFAPGIDPDLPSLGGCRPDYVDLVARRVSAAIGSQRYEPESFFTTASVISSGLFSNRRRPVLGRGVRVPGVGRILMAPHPRGGVDPAVRVAGLMRQGELVAVLWGVSCHPVCSPDPELISACFPGVVRRAIRDHVGRPDLPVLFLQGFSGDVRPDTTSRRIPATPKAAAAHLLAGGMRFVEQDHGEFSDWCGRLARHVCSALDQARLAEQQTSCIQVTRVERRPAGWDRPARLAEVRLSPGLRLLIVNAEVVHERLSDLAEPPGLTVPVGCADEVIGYWPTDRMMREGGYESDTSRRHFPDLDWAAAGGPDRLWRDLLSSLGAASPGG